MKSRWKKHVQSFLTTVVIWMKVLRGLHVRVKPLYFPSVHPFFPLSLPPHILPLSPTFPPSPPKSSGVRQVAIYQRNDFCDYLNIVSFFICKSHTTLSDALPPCFRFWWSISFIETWVSVLSGTNAGISHLCSRVQYYYYLHCILIIIFIDCY